MTIPPRPPWLRYGLVPVAVAAAMLLRWPLWPVLGSEFAYLFLWPVIILCAWYGGLGPGLLATALSAFAADFFLMEPLHSLAVSQPDGLALVVFTTCGCAISGLMEALH